MISNLQSTWATLCQSGGDILLGWLLDLPRDVSLLVLSFLTAGLTLLLRWSTSDQQALFCLRADSRCLARRIREARRSGQSALLTRYRRTNARVARLRIVAEARLALLSLLPLAAIVSWAAARLHYLAPVSGDPIDFVIYTPASAVGTVVHLVPRPDIEVTGGWVREVELTQQDDKPRGRASWSLLSRQSRANLQLETRINSRTISHVVWVGMNRYAPPHTSHGDELESNLLLKTYQPLGWLPALAGLPPWLTGYIALCVVFFYSAKRMLGVS